MLGEHRFWNPCPEKWDYVRQYGSCYFQLFQWKEYTWLQAKEECQKLDNQSTLAYIDEVGEDELMFKLFWRYQSTWSWIGASISSGTNL